MTTAQRRFFDALIGYVSPGTAGPVLLAGDVPLGFLEHLQSARTRVKCESVPVKTALAVTNVNEQYWPLVLVFSDQTTTATATGKSELAALLARARDILAGRVLHICLAQNGTTPHWLLADSLALGFSALDAPACDSGKTTIYQFEIGSYKSTPGWLNSKNWANPGRWDHPLQD